MSTGKDNKTMPQTKAFDEGYDRIFGKDHKPDRGKFIWDAELHSFIPADEYIPPPTALSAPIMVDRFYEGQTVTELDDKNQPLKVDIGTRLRHREYMKQRGLTTLDDFKETHAKAEEARRRIRAGEPTPDPERRDQIGRALYEVEKRGRRK